ncbi:MAG: MmcQ/YjbR family DNA-binding protein [Caulobacterales bacterium]|nr:MmcQ/YjbR family DNA-binding protein [Caulobacterales bacterium]
MTTETDVRRIALSLPEAREEPHFELTSFRVAGKIFCTLGAEPGRIMLKLDPEDQANLVGDDPAAIQPVPGYWGQKGSTYVRYEALEEARLAVLLRLAWATVAPKRLSRLSG